MTVGFDNILFPFSHASPSCEVVICGLSLGVQMRRSSADILIMATPILSCSAPNATTLIDPRRCSVTIVARPALEYSATQTDCISATKGLLLDGRADVVFCASSGLRIHPHLMRLKAE